MILYDHTMAYCKYDHIYTIGHLLLRRNYLLEAVIRLAI